MLAPLFPTALPFPDGFRTEDTSFALFEKSLADLGVAPDNVAGVISETYQGGGADLMPVEYAQALRKWCDQHGALLCFDEVQAGFGRCGRQWGFELYGVVPDLFCCGKGISSSLPLSAVIGRTSVLDLYGPNKMTSTHSGNPICCAEATRSISSRRQPLITTIDPVWEIYSAGAIDGDTVRSQARRQQGPRVGRESTSILVP